MLVSFFYRYSTPTRSSNKSRTLLSKTTNIYSHDGEADLSPVNVEHCTDLFQSCFQRIMNHLAQHRNNGEDQSLVASLIDTMLLRRERAMGLDKCRSFKPVSVPVQDHSSRDPHPQHQHQQHPGKISPGAPRVGHTFQKSGSSGNLSRNSTDLDTRISSKPNTNTGRADISSKPNTNTAKPKTRAPKQTQAQSTKESVKNLKKNGKRSDRGALIPKRRMDLERKLDGMDALMQRGGKNRKNKKKQKRDSAITEFVMKSIS